MLSTTDKLIYIAFLCGFCTQSLSNVTTASWDGDSADVLVKKTYLPFLVANNLDGNVLLRLVIVRPDHLPE